MSSTIIKIKYKYKYKYKFVNKICKFLKIKSPSSFHPIKNKETLRSLTFLYHIKLKHITNVIQLENNMHKQFLFYYRYRKNPIRFHHFLDMDMEVYESSKYNQIDSLIKDYLFFYMNHVNYMYLLNSPESNKLKRLIFNAWIRTTSLVSNLNTFYLPQDVYALRHNNIAFYRIISSSNPNNPKSKI
jgi:hypothetical protein